MEKVFEIIDKNIDTLFTTNRKPSWNRVYKVVIENPDLKMPIIKHIQNETADLFLLKEKQLPTNELNQLKEAYDYLSTKRKNEILKHVIQIMNIIKGGELDKFIETKSAKKDKFENFPFRKSWYNIKSINLRDIVLCKNLITYDTKIKTLYFYTTPYLLNITSSSLKNFDKELSFGLKSINNLSLLRRIQENDVDLIKELYEKAKQIGKRAKQKFNENVLLLWGSKRKVF